jgi:quercetin dioxygenase-like cupin family protein
VGILKIKFKKMSVLKFAGNAPEIVRNGLERRIISTPNLMTVLVDFTGGPWQEPDPYHSHPHEQTSYVASGEIVFYCEDEPEQYLREGDMFAVGSSKMHTIRLLTESARLIDSFTPIRQDFIK